MALDRTALTILLGFAGIFAVGQLRPDEPRGSWERGHPKRTWAEKLEWDGELDVVFAGDSRVVFGIAPEVANELLDARTANFGFLGGGYSADYLEAVERTLDPESEDPIVVLGFSPRSIVPTLTWINEFTEARDLGLSPRLTHLHFSEFLWNYRRLDLEALEEWLRPRRELEEVRYDFRGDGWIETTVVDPARLGRQDRMKPITEPVAPYPPTMIEAVEEYVRRWHSMGVRVYGYRTPVPSERAKNEDVLYRFDEPGLVRRFEEAGGEWLVLPPGDYTFWDSSHMDAPSARAFTRRVAGGVLLDG